MKNIKINIKARVKNKVFWLAFIPAMIMVATTFAAVFGIQLDLDGLSDKLVALVEAVFLALTVLGIVVDPTTEGISDSSRAMGYQEPLKKKK